MNEDLKKIKKNYGEEMMHLCRDLFPTILEKKGLLYSILRDNLAPTHSFAEDIKSKGLDNQFKDWIYSFIDEKKEDLILVDKTPYQLLDEKGYILYECKSEEDIQSFSKYYEPNELICTIKNGGRLERCHVFFAIKKNVDSIKREMFTSPKREDIYGTSVISIQFARGKNNTISIKNRYNHTVPDADSTFNNNLENIASGLTKSFERFYDLNINGVYKNQEYFLSYIKYIKANDNKFYRYNLEIDGIYFCENNIIIRDGKVDNTYANNKERFIVVEQYIIDMMQKKVFSYTDYNDSFINSINGVGNIANIEVKNNIDNKEIIIIYENGKQVIIDIDKNNKIIGYINNHTCKIDSDFLKYNKSLKYLSLDNAISIGDDFLDSNDSFKKVSLPNVLEIGNRFLFNASKLEGIDLPNVKKIGDYFIYRNHHLVNISLPNVLIIGNDFISDNRIIKKVDLPKVQVIRDNFLTKNEKIEEITLEDVIYIGNYFLNNNRILKNIDLPKVLEIGNDFLKYNYLLNSICFNSLEKVGNNFLYHNRYVYEALFPKIKMTGNHFMYSNVSLYEYLFPEDIIVGDGFLQCNSRIRGGIKNNKR